MKPRVLLLLPTTTYKATDVLDAAARLDVDVVIGTDRRQALEREAPGRTVALDFLRPRRGVRQIAQLAAERPFAAVLGVDDETTLLAAMAAEELGLPHNPASAIRASRDKYLTRRRLRSAGLRVPDHRPFRVADGAARAARRVRYPCVLKPLFLSASRGVLRADDRTSFVAAFERIARLLADREVARRGGRKAGWILVEDYVPGTEVALEGLLEQGELRPLALFDKPDELRGPVFEETIYVTPSRLAATVRDAVRDETAAACRALGLRHGPIHAELRLRDGVPWVLEVAGRSIGGLCARTLRFGAGVGLEELVLAHALGREMQSLARESAAAGVMMLPVPRAGVLRRLRGLAEARSVRWIEDVVITLHQGATVVPLPEGHRYLGFLFARGPTPQAVEAALRQAHGALRFDIEADG